MSTHPNAILGVRLIPDGTTRKVYRALTGDDPDRDVKIGPNRYHVIAMEDDYDESFQIQAKEGDVVLLNYLTYGYGVTITWDKVQAQKDELEAWAKVAAEEHQCAYEIFVTANYW
jgi:hypothetical protein